MYIDALGSCGILEISKDSKIKKSRKTKKGKASRRRRILKKAKSNEAIFEVPEVPFAPENGSTGKRKRACKKKGSKALPPAPEDPSMRKPKRSCKKKGAHLEGSEPLPATEDPPACKAKPAKTARPKATPKAKARARGVPPDPAVVKELLTLLWDYAGCQYELTGFQLHEQTFPGLRLNVYWSRNHVGIHDKSVKKDIVNFTSPTETIITHLHLAHMVATYLNCSFVLALLFCTSPSLAYTP